MKKHVAKLMIFLMMATTIMVPTEFGFSASVDDSAVQVEEPTDESKAADQTTEVDKNVQSNETDNTEESDSVEKSNPSTSVDTKGEVKNTEKADKSNIEEEEEDIEEDLYKEMNFLYIESKKLEAPGTQNIVVSWDQGMDEIEKFSLIYRDTNGKKYTLDESKRTDKAILFNKNFKENEIGTYTIEGVEYSINGERSFFEFDDVEIAATFEIVKLQENINDETIAIVDIDSSGSVDKQEVNSQIKSAVAASNITTQRSSAKSGAKAGNLVVVLDPGHGGSDPGATRGSVYEKTLNLKVAQYCKAELEKYSGVTVYMTRTGDSYLTLAQRAQKAADYGADILISIHQNSSESSAAYGAEVYYPNSNYKPAIGSTGKKVAEAVQKELVKLGLDDRGTHIKNTVYDRYSDGSLQDWYGIIRESKLRGVPAIIVEHAFLSNSSDYSNFLNSNSKLQKLGIADATGIAKAFGLSKKTGIEIDTSSYKGMVGDVYQFLVGVYGISGTPKVYSTNTEVVSVKLKDANDFRGRLYELKCLKSGTADIVVELGKYKKSFPVEITAMDYSLDTKSYTMEVGGSYQFLALISNKAGKEAPKVKSSNEKVVKVKLVSSNDKRGYLYEINGVGAGSATISVDYYGVVKTLNVTVKKKNITLSLDTKKYEGKVGDKYQFLAYTNNRNAISKATSSDPSVASIRLVNKNDSRGVLYEIKGLKAGTTTIQVQAGDKTAKFNATYKAMDYSLDTKSYTMEVGGSYQFLALISNKTGKEAPKVKSSNEKVVKVKLVSSNDKRGYLYEINGVGAGSATISVDYYGVVKTLNVTVKKKNITLSLDTKKYEGKVGDKYQFLAYTNNRNAISKATSSDPSVASIRLVNKNDSRGVLYEIKGLKAGTTTIQVQAGDKTAKFNATYKAMDYSLDTKSYTMEVGGSYQFLALIPNKTGKEAPKVKSSNEKVVKVKLVSSNDKRGYLYEINGVGSGSATISVDYYGVVKTLNVTVKKLYEIMGDTAVTVDELMALYSSKGKTYPKYYKDTEAPNLNQFCQIYIEESAEEGVKAEVAFCQAMLETGWLQFGGDVKISQYNFAGIGATGGGAAGASFSDVRTGIRAQVQHLKAYASTSALKNECVDPRFKYVKRGSAKYVEWLGQKENPNGNGWATGKNYGYNILKLINEI